jgi:ParB family chromosome partitioning protein
LVGLENASFLAKKIIEKRLSVRQAENLVKIFKTTKIPKFKVKDPNLKNLELNLSDKIGLNVLIKNNKNNTGSITLEYKNIEQLNKLIEVIKLNY